MGTGGAGGGESSGGQAGSGGGTHGEDGAACIACIAALEAGACATEFGSCRVLIRCEGWLSCTDDCAHGDNTHACYTGCDATFLPSNSANQNLKGCACDQCWEACPSFCTCGEF
jgi:hypothetical protein